MEENVTRRREKPPYKLQRPDRRGKELYAWPYFGKGAHRKPPPAPARLRGRERRPSRAETPKTTARQDKRRKEERQRTDSRRTSTGRPTDERTDKQKGRQAGKRASRRAGEQKQRHKRQASRQATTGPRAGRPKPRDGLASSAQNHFGVARLQESAILLPSKPNDI